MDTSSLKNHHDFSYYLDNYKNQFIAQGVYNTQDNKSLLENAKSMINQVLSELTIEKSRLEGGNAKLEKQIQKMNKLIQEAEKRHATLEEENQKLTNSDKGAIQQKDNISQVYDLRLQKTIMKACLIALILIFLYIKDDVFQAIRGRFSTKIKTV
jgi:preprotein translocase subunit SecF